MLTWNDVAAGIGLVDSVFGGSGGGVKPKDTLKWENDWRKLQYETSEKWNQISLNKAERAYWEDKRRFNQHQANFTTQQGNWEKQYAQSERDRISRIRTTVADAKAAGLHPLYALGGGGGSYGFSQPVSAGGGASSNFIPGQYSLPSTAVGTRGSAKERMMRGITGAAEYFESKKIRRKEEERQNRLDRQQLEVAESIATKNYAEAQLALSESARAASRAMTGQDVSIGQVEKVPDRVTSHSNKAMGVRDGVHATWVYTRDSKGNLIKTPNPEIFEDMDIFKAAATAYGTAGLRAKKRKAYRKMRKSMLNSMIRDKKHGKRFAKSRGWMK